MAKLASADEFKKLVESGKYENKVNAQRAAGRTRLPESEKKKIWAYLDAHFGADGDAPAKPGKKAGKKASKKAGKKLHKRVAERAVAKAAAPATPAPTTVPAAVAKPGKKVTRKAAKKTTAADGGPPGTLPISAAEADSVAGLLLLVDSTVTKGVSIINALKLANELSSEYPIGKGVNQVKLALEGAAHILNQNVISPLVNAGTQADAEVAARLEQVVAASNDPSLPMVAPPEPQQPGPPQHPHFS